jgi:hypothetical protein
MCQRSDAVYERVFEQRREQIQLFPCLANVCAQPYKKMTAPPVNVKKRAASQFSIQAALTQNKRVLASAGVFVTTAETKAIKTAAIQEAIAACDKALSFHNYNLTKLVGDVTEAGTAERNKINGLITACTKERADHEHTLLPKGEQTAARSVVKTKPSMCSICRSWKLKFCPYTTRHNMKTCVFDAKNGSYGDINTLKVNYSKSWKEYEESSLTVVQL